MIAQQGHQKWLALASDLRIRKAAEVAGYGLGGFCISAVSLAGRSVPLAMGLSCALTGWRALISGLGSLLGYLFFWGGDSVGMAWSLGGCLLGLLPDSPEKSESFLIPALAAFWVSASGLAWQMLLGDTTPVTVYLMQVLTAALSGWAFLRLRSRDSLRSGGGIALAQVRLEILAGVLDQTRQVLLEGPPDTVDEEGILARTRERACGSCPVRKTCQESPKLSVTLLHLPLTDTAAMPCRKPSRLLTELRRSQEQLRSIHADGKRRQEYRQAVIQQYLFLGDLLRSLSDQLPRQGHRVSIRFRADAEVLSCGREESNGDLCQCFDGPGGNYYILLCDGMGTGLGAAQEGKAALTMLKKLLTAGFPADHALGSINSLCCLRGRAGAVTVDLAEISLETGSAALYKWGAAPSWLVRDNGAEKIGTAGPPPGLDMGQARETVDRLSLRQGEVLILMSDGVDGEGAMHHVRIAPGEPLGETAAKLLESGWSGGADDATVAAVRLHPVNLST